MNIGEYVFVHAMGKKEVVKAEVIGTEDNDSILVIPVDQQETIWSRENHEWWFTESGAKSALEKS